MTPLNISHYSHTSVKCDIFGHHENIRCSPRRGIKETSHCAVVIYVEWCLLCLWNVMEREVIKKNEHRLVREQRLRKAVYNAIVTLSEHVVETTLQIMLNNLDQSSWMEVVEERYLGRMCGFPLCTNPTEVFEQSSVINKFCCRSCFLRFAAVRSQLKTEPLWIRGDKEVKIFDLNGENVGQQQQDTRNVEFVEDQKLITSLEILKIGVTAESDNEDNNDEINMDEEKEDDADIEFHNLCRPYFTMGSVVASTESTNEFAVKKIADETVAKMEEKKGNKRLSESEKLAYIRNKYNHKFKRPEIIEAKPFSSQLINKVPKNLCGDFERTLSEWCGPETIYYLQYRRQLNLSNNEDEIITETKSIVAQFYVDDRSSNKKIVKDIFLPPIDNVDQAKQRISVLAELLKPSWRFLEKMLNINGFGQQVLEIISTFRLSATNIVFERKICDLAVAAIFRLLAYCDRSLMEFYPSDCIVSSKFTKYLEQIGCDVKYYARILSLIMNKLE